MHQAELRTGEAARILRVQTNTLRAWEYRAGVAVCRRGPGGHRRYDRRVVIAMQDAIDQGFRGQDVVTRAAELIATGRYSEPPALRERMFALEREMDMLITLVRQLQRALR